MCLASRDLFARVEEVVCAALCLVDRLQSACFFIELDRHFCWKHFVTLFGFVASPFFFFFWRVFESVYCEEKGRCAAHTSSQHRSRDDAL